MERSQNAAAQGTQSLRRAVGLLRILSTHLPTGWRLSDIAERTGLDHTTVHRLLAGLLEERLVTRVEGTRRYTLGPLAYELGVASSKYFALDRAAGERLQKLAAETRCVVFLNVRSGFDSVCVARYEVGNLLKAYTVDVGTRRPLMLSAGGVAMMIHMARSEITQVEAQNLEAIESQGTAKHAAVRKMLRRSKRLGYGLNYEDVIPGIAALGIAVCNSQGQPVASISLAAPKSNMPDSRMAQLLGRMREEALSLAGQLGQFRYA